VTRFFDWLHRIACCCCGHDLMLHVAMVL